MISKELQEKILQAVEKTAELVDQGSHPDDAIAQAIVQVKLGSDCVPPIVHAYNTGRTTYQRENGIDPFEKSADFVLASSSEVMKRLYPMPEAVKQAASSCDAPKPAAQYAYSPKGALQRRRSRQVANQAPAVEKAAAAPAPAKPKNVAALQQAAEEARRQETVAFDKLAAVLESFVQHIYSYNSKSLLHTEKQAQLLHGDKVAPIFEYLRSNYPQICKQARHQQPPAPAAGIDATAQQLITTAIDASAAAMQATENYKQAQAAVIQAKAENFLPHARQVCNSLIDVTVDDLVKRATGTGGVDLNRFVPKEYFKPPQTADTAEDYMRKLTDPRHEGELRKLRAESLLNELTASDDVISGFTDDEVLDAYNDIVQGAPALADNRMALQSLLRQRLQQGASSPFEVQQYFTLNKELANTNPAFLPDATANMRRGGGGGFSSQF